MPTQKRVSELPAITGVTGTDLLIVSSNSATKRVAISQIGDYFASAGVAGPTGASSTVTGPAGGVGATGPVSDVAGPTGEASTVAGPTGDVGPTGAESFVTGPTGEASTITGPTGASSTVTGPAGGVGATGAASQVTGPTGGGGLPVVVDLGVSSGTIATDAATCDVVDVAINGTSEIGNPTNSADGQTILWRITRAAADVVTLGAEFSIVSGTISNATNYRTFVRATYSAADSLWFADVTNVEVLPPVFTTGVALLLHMDGADASTVFTDSSSQGLIVGPNGDAQISTAQSVFGGASALFDGSGDYIEISDSSLDLGAGDFCVEGWIRFNTIADGVALVNKGGSGSGGWSLYYYSGTLYFGVPYVSNLAQGAWSAATGVWYHLACTRQGTDLRLFLDGALLDTQTNANDFSSATPCRIGQSHSGDFFDGNVDEVRIVKGQHVYDAAFSVPSSPLTDPV